MKSRKAIELTERVNRRWLGYVAAASSAAIGVFGTTQPAKADIVVVNSGGGFYFSPPGFFPPQVIASIDLNVQGANGFNILASGSNGLQAALAFARMDAFGNMTVLSNGRYLRAGQEIGPNLPVGVGPPLEAIGRFFGSAFVGTSWVSRTAYGPERAVGYLNGGYVGLRFTIDGQYLYGWGLLDLLEAGDLGTAFVQGTLVTYAYNTVPGAPITAGETSSTPEPGTLGLLALGSLGLGFWRRRKAVGSQQ